VFYGEYVRRRDKTVHTQTIEGFFSIFKRGMTASDALAMVRRMQQS